MGWHYHEANDAGWPIAGELNIRFEKGDPQVISPVFFMRAEEAQTVIIDAAFSTMEAEAQVFWAPVTAPQFAEERSMLFPVFGDGKFRQYRIQLAGSPAYTGGIVQLRLDPANNSAGTMRLRSVQFAAK